MTPLRIGLLRLTDGAPLVVAQELGFFADEGLEVALSVEPSWANIADKLAHGLLEATAILPPLAFAVSLGLRGKAEPLVVPYNLSLGGNTVTLEARLGQAVREEAREIGAAAALAARLKRGGLPPLAVVHEFSTHQLLLRYWLASAGVEAGRDYEIVVTPPARVTEALKARRIAGFCAGSPWGEVAARAGEGVTVATSHDIWRNGPEKALAMREAWAEAEPAAAHAVLRALYRAGRFCEAPENAAYVASLLGRRAWLDLDSHAILSSLPGTQGARATSRFSAQAANYPWRSHALWFLRRMTAYELLPAGLNLREIAARVYRPDIYEAALATTGVFLPEMDAKPEGAHASSWMLPGRPGPLAMQPDLFCDAVIFDPAAEL